MIRHIARVGALAAFAGAAAAVAVAQPSPPSTDQINRQGSGEHSANTAAAPARPEPPKSITPAPKPSVDQLSTKQVVPLPSAGGAGVAPPAMPGAPNAEPPGAGSKP